MDERLSRRRLLGAGVLGTGGLLLGACDRMNAVARTGQASGC